MSAPDQPARIAVPRAVYVGLEAVRRSGLTNMLDRPRVAQLAAEMRFDEAAAWVRANRALHAQGVFNGFRPDDVPESYVEPQAQAEPLAAALARIAREELGIETLVERGRDRLDFHDVGVAGLRRALEKAYELGRAAP